MLRASRFHRPLSRLALLAVLLLALAPAAGRMLAAGTPQLLAGWSQLCTAAGLQSLPGPARSADGPQSPAGAHGDGDCPYCPLAASLALPPLLAPAWSMPRAPASTYRRPRTRRRFPRLLGPGSRGPPLQS